MKTYSITWSPHFIRTGLKVKNTSCLQLNNKWHKPDLKERCSCRRSDQCYITALFKKWRLNLFFPSPPGAARDLFPFPAWSGGSLSLQRPITLKISTSDVNANVWRSALSKSFISTSDASVKFYANDPRGLTKGPGFPLSPPPVVITSPERIFYVWGFSIQVQLFK